jgi:zinc finger protein
MEFNWATQDVPHFGEALLVSGTCACGFRHSDTMLLRQLEPIRYTLVIDDPEDVSIRVIRSSSCTIRIPELGIAVEPGPASESFVSNVEGVLERILDMAKFATRSASAACDEEKASRGSAVIGELERAIRGDGCLTMILEDPFGNSSIVSPKAAISSLTEEEVAALQTGMVVIDSSCLES